MNNKEIVEMIRPLFEESSYPNLELFVGSLGEGPYLVEGLLKESGYQHEEFYSRSNIRSGVFRLNGNYFCCTWFCSNLNVDDYRGIVETLHEVEPKEEVIISYYPKY